MIRSRHELKYMVTEAQAAVIVERIRPFMRPDHHSGTGEYPLVSLYLDSQDLRLCRESLDGLKNRYKLRIRSYSDDPDSICFFEIKRRINQVIVKSRAKVPRRDVGAILTRGIAAFSGTDENRRNLEQFLFYRRQIQAEPLVRVRYLRRAFESRLEDDVRVTLDRHLSMSITRAPVLDLHGPGWQRPREEGVILEIKFTHGHYPAWITRLVRDLCLRSQSVSKYARMVTHACALRFCAPLIGRGDVSGERVLV